MKTLPLSEVLREPEGARRTALLVAWFQGLFPEADELPILVGGAAVELYTGGAYVTGDLDFVGSVSPYVAKRLMEAGFEKRGRHWAHEAGRVFLELPGRSLEPASEPVRLRRAGRVLLVIGPEALLADRLAAWKYWGSTIDAANALLLLRALGERMDGRLAARLARSLEVDDERVRLTRFARRRAGRAPSMDELLRWLAGRARSR
ncbi:MAG: hypothetical protein ACYDBY_13360 [Thermoanaerobaculia bacterium]